MPNEKLNIIIPAFNEEKRLSNTLNELKAYLHKLSNFDVEIYVVDDGSLDSTVDEVNKLNIPCLKVLAYSPNKGKGYAIRHGVQNSRKADLYILADADSSTSWDFISDFISIQKNTGTHIVIGSRAISGAKVKTPSHKKYLGRVSSFLINLLLGLNFKDTQCGYKLFTQRAVEAFDNSTLNRWGIDFDFLYQAKKLGLNVVESPVEWNNSNGSKVNYLDYIKTFIELIRIRFAG